MFFCFCSCSFCRQPQLAWNLLACFLIKQWGWNCDLVLMFARDVCVPDSFDSADRLKRMQGAVEQVIMSAGIKPPVSPAPAFAARSPAQPSPHTTVSTWLSQHGLVSTTPTPTCSPFHLHTQTYAHTDVRACVHTHTHTHTHTRTHATISTSLHCSPSKYCLFFVSANPVCILSHLRTHTHTHTHTDTH